MMTLQQASKIMTQLKISASVYEPCFCNKSLRISVCEEKVVPI